MNPYLSALALTPMALIRIVDQVQPARFSESLDEGRFTLLEMVAHLADWEDIMLDRARLALEQPGATVQAYDEMQRAEEKHYRSRDIRHELEVFENRRRDTMECLNGLTPEQLDLTYVHPERGVVSLREHFYTLLGHDLYHLEQATHYMR